MFYVIVTHLLFLSFFLSCFLDPTPPLISQGFLFSEESSTKEDATAAVRLASVNMSDQGARSHILAFTFFCTKYLAPAKNKMLKTTIYKRYFAWLEKVRTFFFERVRDKSNNSDAFCFSRRTYLTVFTSAYTLPIYRPRQ
jgi:hypothetical protein